MKKGYFITFEGIDGSGKTSILHKVYEQLKKTNLLIEKTREPGGENKVCESIRQIVLNESKNINIHAEALLFAASRSQHVHEYIIPTLNKGINVICDRFLDSSIAYQGFGRKIGYDNIKNINEFAIGNFRPDFTLFFDVKPEVANERILINENREKNRFDFEELETQREVYDGYMKIINANENIIIIDASKSFDDVYNETISCLYNIFGIKND